ncbi:hypothetical protein EH93P2_00065 [Enterococcus phage EH93P2]|nr:hypothetical protein EH93P1_00107 [Enterococcus phage EH93P1]WAX15947.1 hypothetical protein EH93P2_00065 [Enterococcus phage EH93P2]
MKFKYNFKKGDVVKCVDVGANDLIAGGLYKVVLDLETDYKEDLLQVKCVKTGLTKEAFVRRFEHVKTTDNHSETLRLAELESIERAIVNEISRYEKEIREGLLYQHDLFLKYGRDADIDWINSEDIVNAQSNKMKLDKKLKEVQGEIQPLRNSILSGMLLC